MAENLLPLAHTQTCCPLCRRGHLDHVRTVDAVNLLCSVCGACWHPGPHLVCRVDPATCSGCPFRGRCAPVAGDEVSLLAG